MTIKRKLKNPKNIKARRRLKKNLKFSANSRMVVYRNPKDKLPYPPRFRTTFTLDFSGYFSAGNATYHYNVALNRAYQPLSYPAAGGGALALPNLTISYTALCTGNLGLMASGMYTEYRVHRSSVQLKCVPLNVADIVLVSITPTGSLSNPATVYVAETMPYTKKQMVSLNRQQGPIKNSVLYSKFLGVSERAITDDLSGQFQAQTGLLTSPLTLQNWAINLGTPDGSNLAGRVYYDGQVQYDVELFNMPQGLTI